MFKGMSENMTETIVAIEDILMHSDIDWLLTYDPETKTYTIRIGKNIKESEEI